MRPTYTKTNVSKALALVAMLATTLQVSAYAQGTEGEVNPAALALRVSADDASGVDHGSRAGSLTGHKKQPFLQALSITRLLAPENPLVSAYCSNTSNDRRSQCPDFARYAGPRGGGPFHSWNLTSHAPNLRVTFVLDEVSNAAVSGDGADLPNRATWLTHSPIATQERYPFGPLIELWAPQPGETWQYGALLYDALVHDGCTNVPAVFPVEFDSVVEEVDNGPTTIGEFHAIDNTTLVPTGFWKFHYVIRSNSSDGGVSDFTFDGTVSVVCTGIENL